MENDPTVKTLPALTSARASDLPAIAALLTAAGLPPAGLEDCLPAVIAARDGERVVGAVALETHGEDALLRSLVVAPGRRGKGLGERLLAAAIAEAKRRRVRTLYLLTETAQPFFAERGFLPVERTAAPAALGRSVQLRSACPASASLMAMTLEAPALQQLVQEKYGQAALRAQSGERAGCCASDCGTCDPISGDLYGEAEAAGLPREALAASLGCGNPTALADLRPGETVLDLGSGGGIDVLLSARRVGPTGKAYGLDMTAEMLELARENQRRAGVENVEFLRGEIERIPLPAGAVDVVISNCVINLSGDKRRVLAEAFRVLKPGGRFAVSDIVVRGEIPAEVRRSLELWVGCVAGALEEKEFRRLLDDLGFEDVEIEPTRIYRLEEARDLLAQAGLDVDRLGPQVEGHVMAAFVRARKPAAAARAIAAAR